MERALTAMLFMAQVFLGVATSAVAFKKSGMQGLVIMGITLAMLFYAKDLYDLWCIATGSNLLGPSWGNHSLVALGFALTSMVITRKKQYLEDKDLKTLMVVLVILLLDVILDIAQDQIHFCTK
jgi:hypothetical protein